MPQKDELIEGVVVQTSDATNESMVKEGLEAIEERLVASNVDEQTTGEIMAIVSMIMQQSYVAGATEFSQYMSSVEDERRSHNGHTMGFSAGR